jgi:lipoprotein-anchoring transpeptidase ErfK/SrfK
MSASVPSSRRAKNGARLRIVSTSVLAAAALALTGCAGGGSGDGASGGNGTAANLGAAGDTSSPSTTPVAINSNVKPGKPVKVDTSVKVSATGGALQAVALRTAGGKKLPGTLAADGATWRAGSLLEPGTSYVLTATPADGGKPWTRRFRTADLSLDEQTYPSIAPLSGQKVGVGMPVIVHFDVPVTNKASIEKHLSVESTPAQKGSWHWFSDTEVHWRPRHYWKAGTKVTVHADVNSVPAGNGIYGQMDKTASFTIGDKHVYKVNMKTDQMKVYSNDKLLRTIPVTTGQPGFITRSGIKVIVEKDVTHTMNSETIGIPKGDPNYYNMKDVQWAMRMTYSGEFIHAAPWSVSSQGHENVSHGCTGMSTENADWLFHLSQIGDVVDEFGTDRPMEVTNGYGDWNMSFKDYQKGSALYSTKS